MTNEFYGQEKPMGLGKVSPDSNQDRFDMIIDKIHNVLDSVNKKTEFIKSNCVQSEPASLNAPVPGVNHMEMRLHSVLQRLHELNDSII